jgi:hypothetical protein
MVSHIVFVQSFLVNGETRLQVVRQGSGVVLGAGMEPEAPGARIGAACKGMLAVRFAVGEGVGNDRAGNAWNAPHPDDRGRSAFS